jgi:hypothetical protein
MQRIIRTTGRALGAAFLITAPASLAAQAGIVVQQKTTFNVARVTNADLQQTISILGTDRSKTVTTGKVKVVIMSVDASGSEIIRLDKDQVVKLDDKKKKFEIMSLAEKRAELAKQQKDAARQAAEAQEKDDMRYSVVVEEARRTGERKTINGFNTEQFSVKITVMGEDTKTKKTAPYMYLIGDIWIDPSQAEAARISAGFARAQLTALGIDPTMATNPYAKWLKDVESEMTKIEGYPIMTTLTFEVAVDSAAAAENREAKPNPLGGLGGLMGRKKEEPAKTGSGRPVVFTATTEVLSISKTVPAASEFEIPTGYTKK